MPLFEFSCKTCAHNFEALVFGDEKAACPECQGKKLEYDGSGGKVANNADADKWLKAEYRKDW